MRHGKLYIDGTSVTRKIEQPNHKVTTNERFPNLPNGEFH